MHLKKFICYVFFSTLFVVGVGFGLGLVFSSSINIRGVEPNVIYSIENILAGNPLYAEVTQPPFAVTQYSPLYYLTIQKIAKILHLTSGYEYYKILVAARFFSFVLALLITGTVLLVCRRLKVSYLHSYIAGIVCFIVPMPWFVLARPDVLATFWCVVSVAAMVFYLTDSESKRKPTYLLLVGSCCYLALLSKQNALVLIPIVCYLLFIKEWKGLLHISLSFLATLLLSSLLFGNHYSLLPSDKNYIYQNMFGGIANGINFELAYTKTYDLITSRYAIFLTLPITCVLIIYKSSFNRVSPLLFLAFVYIFWLFFGIVSSLKHGSAINYLNDTMIVGTILFVCVYQSFKVSESSTTDTGNYFIKYSVTLSVIIFLIALLLNLFRTYDSRLDFGFGRVDDPAMISFFDKELKSHPDSYFSVESGSRISTLRFPSNVVTPHPDITDAFKFTQSIIASKISMMTSGSLRYAIKDKSQTLPSQFEDFKVIYSGKDQEILLNSCAKTSNVKRISTIYSTDEIRKISINFLERSKKEGFSSITIRLKNLNAYPIQPLSPDGNDLRLSWRFLDNSAKPLSQWSPRVNLHCNIDTHNYVDLSFNAEEAYQVKAGFLQVSLVQEGVFWAHDIGVPPLTISWN